MSISDVLRTHEESVNQGTDGTTGLRLNVRNSAAAALLMGMLTVGGCTKENTHAQPNSIPTPSSLLKNKGNIEEKKSHIDDTWDTSTYHMTPKQIQALDTKISEMEQAMRISINIVIANVAREKNLQDPIDQSKNLTIYISRASSKGKTISIIPQSYKGSIQSTAIDLFKRNNLSGAITEILENIRKTRKS